MRFVVVGGGIDSIDAVNSKKVELSHNGVPIVWVAKYVVLSSKIVVLSNEFPLLSYQLILVPDISKSLMTALSVSQKN